MDSVEKAIRDFDDLVQAMRKSLVPGKTWQRQLITDLSQLDRLTQVLRMTRSMGRQSEKVAAAADLLLSALRGAHQRVATGRADQVTRAAMMLASERGKKIGAALAHLAPPARHLPEQQESGHGARDHRGEDGRASAGPPSSAAVHVASDLAEPL